MYKAGEHANGFYVVLSGMVGLYKITEKGKESLIRIYDDNEFLVIVHF